MEPTPVDMILAFLILAGGVWGLTAGAIQVSGPLALILALATLTHAYPDISTRFGTGPPVHQFFPFLLLVFIGLVIYGFMARILYGAMRAGGLGPLNRIAGLGLGLVIGTILAGALIEGLKNYGGVHGILLLRGSALAPAVLEFSRELVAFTQRLFPRPGSEKEP